MSSGLSSWHRMASRLDIHAGRPASKKKCRKVDIDAMKILWNWNTYCLGFHFHIYISCWKDFVRKRNFHNFDGRKKFTLGAPFLHIFRSSKWKSLWIIKMNTNCSQKLFTWILNKCLNPFRWSYILYRKRRKYLIMRRYLDNYVNHRS